MNLEKLGEAVADYAPLLGSMLPIPGGEVLGKVIKHMFGGSEDENEVIDNIKNDPEAVTKLRNIEMQEKVLLEQLMVQKIQLGNEDRANARNREIVTKDRTPSYMSVIFVTCYMIVIMVVILLLKFSTLNTFEEKVLEVIIANLSNANMFILAYYFGSSNNNKA